jgi:hypothetical protein
VTDRRPGALATPNRLPPKPDRRVRPPRGLRRQIDIRRPGADSNVGPFLRPGDGDFPELPALDRSRAGASGLVLTPDAPAPDFLGKADRRLHTAASEVEGTPPLFCSTPKSKTRHRNPP